MHPSIYREFQVCLSPEREGSPSAPGAQQDRAMLYCMLSHKASGQEHLFKFSADTGEPERFIEAAIIQVFPDSTVASILRTLYGQTCHRLTPGWDIAFGARIYQRLQQHTSKGILFWESLIRGMPTVLYAAMSARAVANLRQVANPTAELRALLVTLHSSWRAVLDEALALSFPVSPEQQLALETQHWNVNQLTSLSLLEFGQLTQTARLARLALGYLEDADWSYLLRPMLVDDRPMAGPGCRGHLGAA